MWWGAAKLFKSQKPDQGGRRRGELTFPHNCEYLVDVLPTSLNFVCVFQKTGMERRVVVGGIFLSVCSHDDINPTRYQAVSVWCCCFQLLRSRKSLRKPSGVMIFVEPAMITATYFTFSMDDMNFWKRCTFGIIYLHNLWRRVSVLSGRDVIIHCYSFITSWIYAIGAYTVRAN